jgi:hypothetical protein
VLGCLLRRNCAQVTRSWCHGIRKWLRVVWRAGSSLEQAMGMAEEIPMPAEPSEEEGRVQGAARRLRFVSFSIIILFCETLIHNGDLRGRMTGASRI